MQIAGLSQQETYGQESSREEEAIALVTRIYKEVLQIDSEVYLDMTFVAVDYAATILDSERESQKGIDFWLLSRREGQWKVVSVTNEIVLADEKLPSIFDN